VKFEPVGLYAARWVESDDPAAMKKFLDETRAAIAYDHNGDPVFLARNAWHLDRTQQDHPAIRFLKTKEQNH
jgi:peptide chain release factor 3